MEKNSHKSFWSIKIFFEFQIFSRRNENFPGIKIPKLSKFFLRNSPGVPKVLGNMEIVFVKTGGDQELSRSQLWALCSSGV
jgi:hypothetical protein